MKVTLNWLKDFVPVRMPVEDLARALTAAGLPVASIENPAKAYEGVVIGKILKIAKHPQADRLTVCQVDVGKEVLKIVCGAKNMKEQDVVPVAKVGTTLPGGMRIEQATIRGESSFGMMCSKRELGMGENHEGLFILDAALPVGKPFAEAMGLDDTVLDVEVTPNRADCLSVLGIAREISAITNVPLKKRIAPESLRSGPSWDIRVEAKEDCWMYCGCLLEGAKVGPSPAWLQKRLELVGLRSINNVVDITNYVLWAYGQPLHAFDANTLADSKIVVRRARPGESIKTIDQTTRVLDTNMLVIADGRRPVAVAGLMGGAETEISERSHRIFLESALFAPASVRRTSRKLGLISDSSYRFERGVDPEGVEAAMHQAVTLLMEWTGAKPGKVHKVATKKISVRKISVDAGQMSRLLGMESSAASIQTTLRSLGFDAVKKPANTVVVTVPSFRADVADTVDIAEEFARMRGYEKIPVTFPFTVLSAPEGAVEPDAMIRNVLLSLGFNETVHLSFIGAKRYAELAAATGWQHARVKLENPVDEDQCYLRPTLLDGLLRNMTLNQNRGAEQTLVFEIGNVFEREGETVGEKKMLGIAATGLLPLVQWEGKTRAFDFFDLKGAVEELLARTGLENVTFPTAKKPSFQFGQCCSVEVEGKRLGTLGKIHPIVTNGIYGVRSPVFFCEMELQTLLHCMETVQRCYKPISKFPAIVRDIAVVVDQSVSAAILLDALKGFRGPLLEDAWLFDLFQGGALPPGKKSLAYRLRYCSQERTLTESDVQALHGKILDKLKSEWHCDLREA